MTEATLYTTEETTTRTVRDFLRHDRWVWIAGGLLALLVGREVMEMAPVWDAVPESSHSFLVLPAFAYLVWRKRAALGGERVEPLPWAGLLAGGSLLLFLLGKQSGLPSFYRSAVVLLIWSYALWVLGSAVCRRLAGACAVLLFLVPPPRIFLASVSVPLQRLATEVSCAIAGFLGVSLTHHGTTVHLPQGTLAIEAACSGLRGAITLALIAIFLGELRNAWLRGRIVLVGAALGLALVLNIVRVLATILLVSAVGLAAVTSAFHEALGIAVIAAGAIILAALPIGRGQRQEVRT